MNYTKNHHLPQWVSSDRVRMSDFNDAMANIESGMSTNAEAAAAAQTTADNAYSPDNKPFVVGSYTGQTGDQKITLGFMPSFLIVSGMRASFTEGDTTAFDRYFAMIGSTGSTLGGQMQYRLRLLEDGFIAYQAGNNNSQLPLLNQPNRPYFYIAFR